MEDPEDPDPPEDSEDSEDSDKSSKDSNESDSDKSSSGSEDDEKVKFNIMPSCYTFSKGVLTKTGSGDRLCYTKTSKK